MPRPSHLSRAARLGAVLLALVACVLVAAALVPDTHASGRGAPRAMRAVAAADPTNTASSPRRRVDGAGAADRRLAAVATSVENGITSDGEYVDDLTPLSWRQVLPPIARYKTYAEAWAARLGAEMVPLTTRLRAGDRAGAQRDWQVAFADYLHLGAVYGFLPGDLDDRLAEVPPSTGATDFPGLHRIEKGLWTGQPVRSLVPVATAISAAVVQLRHTIPGMWVGAFGFTLRGHEIMEDAQRDLMSGDDVPWSQDGVGATAAALVAEREVIATLTPLLRGRDNTLGTARYWLARLSRAFATVRRRDGSYPALDQLTTTQRELIDGTLAGTCAALSAVPETLELHPTPTIPSIPGSR